MIPCLGAWCHSRTFCANYFAELKNWDGEYAQRLCGEQEEPNPLPRTYTQGGGRDMPTIKDEGAANQESPVLG